MQKESFLLVFSLFFMSLSGALGLEGEGLSDAKKNLEAHKKERSFKVDAEVLFDFRSDELREDVNNRSTAIRNLSLRVSGTPEEKGEYLIELLGDDDLSQEGFSLNIGELYYKRKITEDSWINSTVKAGLYKLNYGLLNPDDDKYLILPSYYRFLYGLPRGIDAGLYVENELLKTGLYFGAGVYLGRTVRASDNAQRDSFGTPFSLKLGYRLNENHHFTVDYFIREYEGSPRIRGLGASYTGHLEYKGFDFDLFAEFFNLNSNISNLSSSANVFSLSPRVQYKSLYLQGLYSKEVWNNLSLSTNSESYLSLRAGYSFTKTISLEIEKLEINNDDLNVLKEESYIARLYMNFSF